MKKDAEAEKGVTGGNAARLLFWPLIVGTYMNANEAISAADNRKVHIANQLIQKNCQVPGSSVVSDSKSWESTKVDALATAQSKEMRLIELKKLFDSGLLTNDIYAERQRLILSGQ